MNPDFKDYLLNVTQSSACKEIEVIQSLWSGYGKISRYQLDDSSLKTIVIKFISLNDSSEHPRGWNTDYSHNRKVKSYEVETHWYKYWNQRCTATCRVPKYIGSFSAGKDQWIILEDLNHNFPLRKDRLDISEVKTCLRWLANFHATFLSQSPKGLWEVGTYWHLKTRPDEFEKITHQELKSKAHLIDELLNQCKFQTIVHGDAKVANFCFSENGKEIAAVDFQYVGGGCGMKDVAYFLGSCLSSEECELHQNELLDFYFSEFRNGLKTSTSIFDFTELEDEWRKMYPLACADFTRFLLGWMPSHQKINDYNLNFMKSVLSSI
ncbi:MAG: thiamine kinase-like enzyme [Flavobacteriales bacterium]|jgi:thiamine kinase-like enzyme